MGIAQELTTYRQTAVDTASPVELVIMLCDALVRDMKQVIAAIRNRDIDERVKQSNQVFLALQELELMLDFENGEDTAKELARVYSHVRAKLIEAQIKLDPMILERQIEFISQLRQAWQQCLITAKQTAASNRASEIPASREDASFPYASMGVEAQSCSWSA
jgi:flagellar protein FliS